MADSNLWIHLICIVSACILASGNEQTKAICNQKKWCAECINARPECAWCNDKDFTGSRCSTTEELASCDVVIFPDHSGTALKNFTLHDGSGERDPVQLQPQHMKIMLRVGKPYSFNMKYAVAKNLPIDMYFVLDFTKTMQDRLQALANLTGTLIKGLNDFTENIMIGYGSFVDKVIQPFTLTTNHSLQYPCGTRAGTKCERPYGFLHRKKLNRDIAEFTKSISSPVMSSNFDQMEGGLDAVLQAAVCPDIIGWRNQSRRVMVYLSDGGYHFAGDAKLAGLDKPNDGRCHLKQRGITEEYLYTESETQDYPSLAQLVRAIEESNINTYFIVKEDLDQLYSELSKMSEQLGTATFKSSQSQYSSDAQKIVNEIITAYIELTKKITITANDIPQELDVLIASNCGTGGVQNTRDLKIEVLKCLEVGKLVNFNVTITAKSCPKDTSKPQRFVIAPQGMQERLVVDVEYICDCGCEKSEELDQTCTAGNGTYECGVCRCNPQRSGEYCQCDNRDQDQATSEQLNKIQQNQCKVTNSSEILCSSKGLCKCGQCICFNNYFGKYCECDKKLCLRPGEDEVCSGNGDCTCSGCECRNGYTGEHCECPPADCLGENGICNGRGECVCGKCQCLTYYNGTYCEECKAFSLSKCEKCVQCGRKECVECLRREGKQQDNSTSSACRSECTVLNITWVDRFGKDDEPCPSYDKDQCETSYMLTCDDTGSYLQIANKQNCPKPPRAEFIALPLLGGILGVGILMIIIWKILTSFYDKIEYARFEHEIQNPKWSKTDNPIYKTATTSNQNPMYQGE